MIKILLNSLSIARKNSTITKSEISVQVANIKNLKLEAERLSNLVIRVQG